MSATRRKVERLYKEQGGICPWCKLPMYFLDTHSSLYPTVDHLRPSDGKFREAVAAHRFCNSARGHKESLTHKCLAKAYRIWSNHMKYAIDKPPVI